MSTRSLKVGGGKPRFTQAQQQDFALHTLIMLKPHLDMFKAARSVEVSALRYLHRLSCAYRAEFCLLIVCIHHTTFSSSADFDYAKSLVADVQALHLLCTHRQA